MVQIRKPLIALELYPSITQLLTKHLLGKRVGFERIDSFIKRFGSRFTPSTLSSASDFRYMLSRCGSPGSIPCSIPSRPAASQCHGSTSRAALNRLLDEHDSSLSLTTLASVAALGKKVNLKLTAA
jgi:hypothetical protein